jgi:hypothetical protein
MNDQLTLGFQGHRRGYKPDLTAAHCAFGMRQIVLFAALAALASASQCFAQAPTVFDTIHGSTGADIAPAPHTFMGQDFNLLNNVGGPPVSVSWLIIDLESLAAVSYKDVALRVQFWNTASGATSGTSPAFSNPIGGPIVLNLGPQNFGAQLYDAIEMQFPTPIILPSVNALGVVFNWEGDTGAGLVSDTNLTTAVTTTASSTGLGLYYRNVSGETDFNFPGSDARQIGPNSTLEFALLGQAVPEPGSLLLCGLVAAGSARCWRRRRTG